MTEPLLKVEDLTVAFGYKPKGEARVVRQVSFELARGETVGIVGESGSGKSTVALAIMGLSSEYGAHIVDGRVTFNGRDIATLGEREMLAVRGGPLAMIFQDPLVSLDPVFTIGWQMREAIRLHNPHAGRSEVRARILDLLRRVGITEPELRLGQYPYEFSGGMRQRVMIAMALANNPQLLIADEPTTALDVTVQSQVLQLLRRVRSETGLALLLITHDLGVVAEMVDRVMVMYAGEIVESATVENLFDRAGHPYTIALMQSRPANRPAGERLAAIPGQPLGAGAEVRGCRFASRCWLSRGRAECSREAPRLSEVIPRHWVACHFAEEAMGAPV